MLDRYQFAILLVCCVLACGDSARAVSLTADPQHASSAGAGTTKSASSHPETLKIALLGDQGVRADARAVLQLIVDEGADALIHLGDFAYSDGTAADWDAQL